jgi:hypothetical protein
MKTFGQSSSFPKNFNHGILYGNFRGFPTGRLEEKADVFLSLDKGRPA